MRRFEVTAFFEAVKYEKPATHRPLPEALAILFVGEFSATLMSQLPEQFALGGIAVERRRAVLYHARLSVIAENEPRACSDGTETSPSIRENRGHWRHRRPHRGWPDCAVTDQRPLPSFVGGGPMDFVAGADRALSLAATSTAVTVTDSMPLVAGTVRLNRRCTPPLGDDTGSVTTDSGPSSTRQYTRIEARSCSGVPSAFVVGFRDR